jgi:hypothetical protein
MRLAPYTAAATTARPVGAAKTSTGAAAREAKNA